MGGPVCQLHFETLPEPHELKRSLEAKTGLMILMEESFTESEYGNAHHIVFSCEEFEAVELSYSRKRSEIIALTAPYRNDYLMYAILDVLCELGGEYSGWKPPFSIPSWAKLPWSEAKELKKSWWQRRFTSIQKRYRQK